MISKAVNISILLFSLLLICVGNSVAQIGDDYVPIRTKDSKLPNEFFNYSKATISANINGGEELDPLKLDKLSRDIYHFRKEYTEGGNFYLNNELTNYVQGTANELLASMPNEKSNFTFYLSRSMEINAFCMADGTVIINLGLIASLDNESQLAFIMAHELSHYIKKHSVKDMQRTEQVLSYDNTNQGSNKSIFRRLQFSRDSEFDADGFAINLLAATNFDPNEGVTALEKLRAQDTLTDSDPTQILLTKYFETEYCHFDSAWISEEAIDKMNSREKSNRTNLLAQDFGDLLSTHPEIEKRQYALKEIISNFNFEDIEKTDRLERKDFDYIKQVAQFEMVENSMRSSYYTYALYNAVRLLEYHPKNIYLNTTLSKSLYWISYYKEINSGKSEIRQPITTNDKAFFRVKAIIENLDVTAAKKLSYGNAKILSDELPSNELTLFYMALNTEHYLGKNASFTYYNKYLKTYPNGQYVTFVNNRLDQMQ
jgi:hypothetical protein